MGIKLNVYCIVCRHYDQCYIYIYICIVYVYVPSQLQLQSLELTLEESVEEVEVKIKTECTTFLLWRQFDSIVSYCTWQLAAP